MAEGKGLAYGRRPYAQCLFPPATRKYTYISDMGMQSIISYSCLLYNGCLAVHDIHAGTQLACHANTLQVVYLRHGSLAANDLQTSSIGYGEDYV